MTEYSDSYSKASGSLWKYYWDEPALTAAGTIIFLEIVFHLKCKENITCQTGNDGTKDVKIMALLKHLSNFWGTIEMALINCEINLILTWSEKWFIVAGTAANQAPTSAIIDRKFLCSGCNFSIPTIEIRF